MISACTRSLMGKSHPPRFRSIPTAIIKLRLQYTSFLILMEVINWVTKRNAFLFTDKLASLEYEVSLSRLRDNLIARGRVHHTVGVTVLLPILLPMVFISRLSSGIFLDRAM
jgi:hypothetical protein